MQQILDRERDAEIEKIERKLAEVTSQRDGLLDRLKGMVWVAEGHLETEPMLHEARTYIATVEAAIANCEPERP